MSRVARLLITAALFLSQASARAELSPLELEHALAVFVNSRPRDVFLSISERPPLSFERSAETKISLDAANRWDDDYALIWTPFPVGIAFNAERSDRVQSTVAWRLGSSIGTSWELSPKFDSYYRRHLTARLSLEAQLEYGVSFSFDEKPSRWSLGFAFSSHYQLMNGVALVPFLQFQTEDALTRRFFPDSPTAPPPDEYFRRYYPFGVAAIFNLSNSAKTGIEYVLRGLGQPNPSDQAFRLSFETGW